MNRRELFGLSVLGLIGRYVPRVRRRLKKGEHLFRITVTDDRGIETIVREFTVKGMAPLPHGIVSDTWAGTVTLGPQEDR